MKIFKIKSELPVTDYAPSWNISIGSTLWDDSKKIDTIRNWLISNEDMIKERYPVSTIKGDTGLGDDSISSRIGMYNLFEFSDELPELKDLLNFLQKSYLNFVKAEYASVYDLVLVSWVNILRNGETIKEHTHSASSISYLSGNMHLDTYPTKTIYKNPYEKFNDFAFENVKGGLTIFPSYVPHSTSEYSNPEVPRVSLAFDLRLPYTVPIDNPCQGFMNRAIFEQLTPEI